MYVLRDLTTLWGSKKMWTKGYIKAAWRGKPNISMETPVSTAFTGPQHLATASATPVSDGQYFPNKI